MKITHAMKADRLDEIIAWADNRRRHIENDPLWRSQDRPLNPFVVQQRTEHRALCAVLEMAGVLVSPYVSPPQPPQEER